MNQSPLLRSRRAAFRPVASTAFLCLGLVVAAFPVSSQILDLNTNGISDVWELIHNAGGISPLDDNDADSIGNRLESIAGTSPFDPNSVPRLSPLTVQGSNAVVNVEAALGKLYQLQSAEVLCGPDATNWITESSIIARSGPVINLNAPASLATKFFRLVVSDVDSDGVGLSDWEEYQLGLNPTNSASSGQLDANGQLLGDYAYALSRVVAQNRVSIFASDPAASRPDPGDPATAVGIFTVSREGFPLDSITVNLGLGDPGTGFASEGVDHEYLTRPIILPVGTSAQNITVTPISGAGQTPLIAMMKVLPGSGYTIGIASNASVVIYPSPTPTGTGLTAQYFTNSSTNYSSPVNFNPTSLFLTRVDPVVDFVWGATSFNPNLSNGFYTVRWTGQVQPQYSELYFFDTRTDDGVKLWVNDQLLIDKWQSQSATTWTNTIQLQAGVRYNLRMEYLNRGGSARAQLSWFSESQPKQIIPVTRLYPSTNPAPSAITSSESAVGFVGQPFSFTVTGANSPLGYSAAGLPPGLGFNTTNGVISGVPQIPGVFQVSLTASNAQGAGASTLNLQIFETGSAVTREVWTNVPGTSIADIPVDAPPSSLTAFGALEDSIGMGDDYAERIRGYITAPTTGNYYFWIAAGGAAELWISNDHEPVNRVRRSRTVGPTGLRQWTLQPQQKSGWLALVAGRKYYVEILHKAGAGASDHWSVGWLLDPAGTNNTPAGVVPAHLLSRHFPAPPALIPGTLYSANMLAQGTAASSGVGSATLRVNADGSQAVLRHVYSGLTTPVTAAHIHSDPYLSHPSQIIFDLDDAEPEPDGSLVWSIGPVGTLSAADIREIIKQGKSYINIHTVTYPNGEINGHFTLAEGSQTFTPPPAPPTWTPDHSNSNAAARFLIQATFGPGPSDLTAVQSLGYEGWIDQQFALPVGRHLPLVLSNPSADPTRSFPGSLTFNTWWRQAVTAPDQLRQRVAFALSEIMVVSESGVLQDNARALSDYYDTLLDHSFGNFRDLLREVTLSPAMGLYLDMRRNEKGDLALGRHPNENYAREILQLFSAGLYRMWPDGTLIMNSEGNLVPTYEQDEVLGFSRVFTGWNYYQTNQANGRLPTGWSPAANYTNQMVLVPLRHELGTKRVLDNVVLPAAHGSQADNTSTNFDYYCSQDLELALDSIFHNENVGPYICRQLIQRLVTSHPSRDYLYRVVQKFNDNGAGVRGDLQAVIKAILLDYEARSTPAQSLLTYGKQREPLMRVTAVARAFPAPPTISGTYEQNGTQTITVTTPTPHRLNNNDDVFLNFTSGTGTLPPSQGYNNVALNSTTVFRVTAPGLSVATYGQSDTTITVTNTSHGLTPGYSVFLVFTTGGAVNGEYSVLTVPSSSVFTVTAPDSATRAGNCLFPKWSGTGGFVQAGTNVTLFVNGTHGLNPADRVFIRFPTGTATPNGEYQVVSVPAPNQFTIYSTVSVNNVRDNGTVVFPLVAPPLVRSGEVTLQYSTWNVGATDTGNSSSLSQTPLNAPTVFNYFFPDYKFPGMLASAGLTTPEFQLTSDTSVALLMNFLQGGILGNNGNTNGITSFTGGDGDIVIDIGPWITPANTSNAGLPGLIDALSSRLCGGPLSAAAKTEIVTYASGLPYTTPTRTQMRDRVRAVVHLIITSPEFSIQR